MAQHDAPGPDATPTAEARLSRLEAQMTTLAEAVRALAHGMEAVPSQDTPPEETARGARLAHEILLSQGL
ncbi:hypothetical protein ITI46_02135 [Streptomyces oryzae]|uniref:Uncharacterized protein n=1 Tax=Streptomyces oryzae TaxID=1434886 RepID=A0ABS3X597_9ACTN|nr:hypothetical protein [Streptomyces oryzae]MBO8190516.1 hypothetical protein [Streptomyces oryzae]